jgi:DNA-binding IclR family transcriptional regulator
MGILGIFGTDTTEKVLLYIACYGEGYANGIAETFKIPVSMIQRQLLRLESQGLLVSQLKGKTRMFLWNPRYPLLEEVQQLLRQALRLLPASEREAYYMKRTRPRRTGKPL